MLVAIVFGEPVKYRQNQRARASAKQTAEAAPVEAGADNGIDSKSEQGNSEESYVVVKSFPSGALLVVPLNQVRDPSNSDSTTVESTTSGDDLSAPTESNVNPNAGGPYSPPGWRPAGRLLVLPNENFAATTTEEPTTEPSTTQRQQKNQSGRLSAQQSEQEEIAVADNASEGSTPASNSNVKDDAEEIEEAEPQKQKENGKLEAENSSDESNGTTTEADNESTTTEQPSSKLETTSEPESEAVDVEQQPKPVNTGGQSQPPPLGPGVQPGSFIIQLPDGSLQRFVFIAAPNAVLPPANLQPNAILPVSTSPFQQLIQPQAAQTPQQFGYNPIASPRVVTFSSQYQSF